MDEMPAELAPYCGQGLRHWQYPKQFAPYLTYLAGCPIRTYLEVGCRHGGTFVITVEYLSRFRNVEKAVAVDILNAPGLVKYASERAGARFVCADSQSRVFSRLIERDGPFDLALIDGDHSEEGCQRDLDVIRPHAKIVVLHDIVSTICPGVPAVWERFKSEHAQTWRFHEFVDQYDEVMSRMGAPYMGIGVAARSA
ncbi:MAG: class I SAM-dependent methyltransferase [Solirubrobacteraceae bacterium]